MAEADDEPTVAPPEPTASTTSSATTSWQSVQRAQEAIQSLSLVLGPLPDALVSSDNPAAALLHDETVASEITRRLRGRGSGAGDDNLCRWLYDTFQTNDPDLQLVVLNFTPTVVGVYLSRAVSRRPLAGFEAVLLALYAYETVIRGGEPESMMLPNLANPSVYHEAKAPTKKVSVELNMAVISPALEPYGTVRSTKRARIVGVALELYYSKISSMPTASKQAFCEFCVVWSGKERAKAEEDNKKPDETSTAAPTEYEEQATEAEENGEAKGKAEEEEEEEEKVVGRIPLPWELFQPLVRIVGHCLLGPPTSGELKVMAYAAGECLHWRATHDMKPQEILATRSLLRLGKMAEDTIVEPPSDEYTEEASKTRAPSTLRIIKLPPLA